MTVTMNRREMIGLCGSAAAWPFTAHAQQRRLLYLTHSAGYRHEAIPLSRTVLSRIGQSLFDVTATEDTSQLTTENLARYAVVMFFTTGELPMSAAQKSALLDFVRAGRGFVGVHSATDTFYEWPDYGALIGGYFDGHPWHQSVRVRWVELAGDETRPV